MKEKKVILKVKREREDIPLPLYATPGSSGLDLRASEDVLIPPGEWKAVATGIRISLPSGYEAQIRPRSGLALKHGVTVLNSPGTVDSDYRGEVKVILINHGKEPFLVRKGDRIAQMVIAKVEHVEVMDVEVLDETERGEGGFGHTGIK
ncbi:MAG: dUTP diphosphatase [Synergistetes bacterium]|nr:MAG: Deoxyuridine 5'-triphosphate nucleotidohydrolase [bacterium 42_11]MBC7331952.1 dUTP diphosphatase [Synergistota bacterium]MDK2871098.1 dUTP pyrophosphatase [bacterium]